MHSSSSSGEEVNSPIPTLCAREEETVAAEYLPTHGVPLPLSSRSYGSPQPTGTFGHTNKHEGRSLSISPAALPPPSTSTPTPSWFRQGCSRSKSTGSPPRRCPRRRDPTARCSPPCNARAEQPHLSNPGPKLQRGKVARPGSRGSSTLLPHRATQVCQAPGNGVYEG